MAKQTDRLVWMSLKPQQPYIPSSSTYLNLQTNKIYNCNFLERHNLNYIETSALDATNIQECFVDLVLSIFYFYLVLKII